MPEITRVGILGAGWPGLAHAAGYRATPGFRVLAVADLIPSRRRKVMTDFGAAREYPDAADLLRDKEIDAVSVCLPNNLHAPTILTALRAGKHVICEFPPTLTAKEARQIDAAAAKSGKVLLYAAQRRFGPHEQAARQAIDKGYAGDIYHARASWMRTRGIPIGTGWFTDKSRSGGGALIDLGLHLLDLAWFLLGQPRPLSVYALTQQRFGALALATKAYDVEDAAFALIKFENGKSLELACSWALNQPPSQNGTLCRLHGTSGAVEVYTPHGAVLYRHFGEKGDSKATPLKGPKTVHHAALMRHFRECILGKATPLLNGTQAVTLMQLIDALYKSAETGKSVEIKG
jgi:predicted dehydrogenase